MNTPFDEGNPYRTACNPNRSRTQIGFTTFGSAHVLALLSEVTTRAHRAAWYQKWFVHRRLRPEAYAGLIELNQLPDAGIRAWLIGREALIRTHNMYGSYFLPQAFPEGSPTHPAYPSGHSTVAGACATILKAFFEECTTFRDPVEATVDGLDLVPYRGDDAGRITIGGELNKLAANISIARDMAGVHWRTDYTEGMRLGECVAVALLVEQANDYYEAEAYFTFTGFDGRRWRINCGAERQDRIIQLDPQDCDRVCYRTCRRIPRVPIQIPPSRST
jgi:membrane-associated phospholipid phosphatase